MIKTCLAAAVFGMAVAISAAANAAPIAPLAGSVHSATGVTQTAFHRHHCVWEHRGHHRVKICR
jgi:hypothetical protein